MNLHELRERVNRMTYAKARAMAQGFQFSPITVTEDLENRVCVIRGSFKCVCGRIENFQDMIVLEAIESLPEERTDAIGALARGGSFSREHLLNDGYTEQQVQEIERKGLEFDLSSPVMTQLLGPDLARDVINSHHFRHRFLQLLAQGY